MKMKMMMMTAAVLVAMVTTLATGGALREFTCDGVVVEHHGVPNRAMGVTAEMLAPDVTVICDEDDRELFLDLSGFGPDAHTTMVHGGGPLRSGQRVTVTGYLDLTLPPRPELKVISVLPHHETDESFIRTTGPARRAHTESFVEVPKGTQTFSALFVQLNFGDRDNSCGTKQGLLDLVWDGTKSVAGAYSDFSNGRVVLEKPSNYDTYHVAGPYTNAAFSYTDNCDTHYKNTWLAYARDRATEDGYDLTKYATLVVVLPRLSGCQWLGRATLWDCEPRSSGSPIPKCLAVMADCDEFVFSHELGHNLFLHHSAEDTRDTQALHELNSAYVYYADWSCLMGNRDSWNVLNAAKVAQKGWINSARVAELDASMSAGGEFTLSPLDDDDATAPNYQIVSFRDKITDTGTRKTYYLSVRKKIGYADNLQTEYLQGVNVHTRSSSQDYSFYVRSLTSGSPDIVTTNTGWTLQMVSFTSQTSAVVRIVPPGSDIYTWVGDWSACSATCGGTQTRSLTCENSSGQTVSSSLCGTRPEESRSCGSTCITYFWFYGQYGSCDAPCGGITGQRTRTAACLRSTDSQAVSSSFCTSEDGPADTTDSCVSDPCDASYSWSYSAYGECDALCGGRTGTETRTATCLRDGTSDVVADSLCTAEDGAPSSLTRSCTSAACAATYSWTIWSYGSCSEICGGGVQARNSVCRSRTVSDGQTVFATVSDSFCPASSKPDPERECNTYPCPAGDGADGGISYAWYSYPFGECSVACGGGVRERKSECRVTRLSDGSSLPAADAMCEEDEERPASSEACNEHDCPADTLCNPADCNGHGRCGPSNGDCECEAGYAGSRCGQPPSVTDVHLEYDGDSENDFTVRFETTGSVTAEDVKIALNYRAPGAADFNALPIPVSEDSNAYTLVGDNVVTFASYATNIATTGTGTYQAVVRYSATVFNVSEEINIEFGDECEPVRCLNGGQCVPPATDGARPVCNCTEGYEGDYCDAITATQCSDVVCENNGACDTATGTCDCSNTLDESTFEPFGGTHCEAQASCSLSCPNGAYVAANCSQCVCVYPWTGALCTECGRQCGWGSADASSCDSACACSEPDVTGDGCDIVYTDMSIGPFSERLVASDDDRETVLAILRAELATAVQAHKAQVEPMGALPDGAGDVRFWFRLLSAPLLAVDRGGVPDYGSYPSSSSGFSVDNGRNAAPMQADGDATISFDTAALDAQRAEVGKLIADVNAELANPASSVYKGAALGLLDPERASAVSYTPDSGGGGSSSSGGGGGSATPIIIGVVVSLVVVALVAGAFVHAKRRRDASGSSNKKNKGKGQHEGATAAFQQQRSPVASSVALQPTNPRLAQVGHGASSAYTSSSSHVTGGESYVAEPSMEQNYAPPALPPRDNSAAAYNQEYNEPQAYYDDPAQYGESAQHDAAQAQHDASMPLPDGWAEYIDEASSSPYWYNEATGESTWEKPTAQ